MKSDASKPSKHVCVSALVLAARTLAVLLVLSMGILHAFVPVAVTRAYFNDLAAVQGHALSTGSLSFLLTDNGWTPVGVKDVLIPNNPVTETISITNNGSLNLQYSVGAKRTAGNTRLCNELEVSVTADGVLQYSGLLMQSAFSVPPIEIATTSSDNWQFAVILPASASAEEFQNKTCNFAFTFDGWQIGLGPTEGFTSHGEVAASITTKGVIVDQESTKPIADAYVNENNPNTNYGSSETLRIRTRNSRNNRTFIKFDFRLPVGTIINSALLKARMYAAPSVSRTYQVQRVIADWVERGASGIRWNNQPEVESVATDIQPTGISVGWISWNVQQDVQNFVNGTDNNYGWRISDTTEGEAAAITGLFRSSEGAIAQRPVLEVSFTAPAPVTDHIVINEVFANTAAGQGTEPQNEWIEIYNPTASAINISGWKLCDNGASSTCDILPATAPIPSFGFAVITPNVSTWTHWPDIHGATAVVLGSPIGNGLANDGDRLILRDGFDNIVDQLSYGTDTTVMSPAIPVPDAGFSIARIVKGFDTDVAGDWVVNVDPNPGTNPSESGSEIMRFTSEGVIVADAAQGLEPLTDGQLIIEEIIPDDEEEPEEIAEQVTQNVVDAFADMIQTASTSEELFTPEIADLVASPSVDIIVPASGSAGFDEIASGSADETLVPTGSNAADVASPSFESIASESVSEEETLVPPEEEIVASDSENTQEPAEQASTVVPVTEDTVTTEEPVTEDVESVEPATEEQAAPDASGSETEPTQVEEAPQSPVIVPEPVSVDPPAPAPAPEPEAPTPSAPVEVPAPAVPDAAPAAE